MYIAIAAVVGLILGFVFGFLVQGKKIGALQTTARDAREELDYAKRESTTRLEEERSKAKLMMKELAQFKAQAKLQRESADQVAKHKTEINRLREGLQKAEDGRIAIEQLAAGHRAKAEDAEHRFQQAQSAGTQWQQRSEQIEKQARVTEQEVKSLNQLLDRKERELKLAQTATTLRQETAAGTRRTRPTSELFLDAGDDLERVLRVLIEQEEQRVAVLADTNGIVVAASGDGGLKEGMAATSQLVEGLTKQLDGMVPFAQLRSFVLQDNMSNVIAGRTFECAGETVGLATYGPRLPEERIVKGAMNNLGAILG